MTARPRLTKQQRADVVELLRCAADLCNVDSSHGLYSVAQFLGLDTWDTFLATEESTLVWRAACDARNHVHAIGYWWGYWHECLEAAQRVEDKEWPDAAE